MASAAEIMRLYDFAAGGRIRSGEVDAELNQLVAAHNTVVGDLTSLEGDVAEDIPATSLGTPDTADPNVQAKLLWLRQYIEELAAGFVLGELSPGSVTPEMLSFDPATQAELTTAISTFSDALMDGTVKTNLNAGKINSLQFRNNAGTLEWSADGTTWEAAGGMNGFEFGLPLF